VNRLQYFKRNYPAHACLLQAGNTRKDTRNEEIAFHILNNLMD